MSKVFSKESNKKKFLLILKNKYFIIVLAIIFLLLYFISCINDKNTFPLIWTQSQNVNYDDDILEFGLVIEKIDIVVPVKKNVDGYNQTQYTESLKNGIAHFKDTNLPGENGNIFIFGHSSSDLIEEETMFSEIFKDIDLLEKGDEIIIYYENKKYSYIIFDKKIVSEDDLSVLDSTDTEKLTLMTCWPIGTDEKRMIVLANPK
jgi:LPXTG-site transpeptidase (sortase) family protein